MNIKFVLLSFLLLFARGCDFYSTSLWYFDNPQDEMNPLSSIFGVGWYGLIIANVIIVALILYAHYYYSYKYTIQRSVDKPKSLTEYISEIYYNKKNKFYQVFYRIPKNKSVYLAHSGYVLIRATIIGSLLAALNNLCHFYNISIFDVYSRIMIYPGYIIYAVIILSIFYFTYRLWKSEYSIVRKMFDASDVIS